MLRVRTVRLIAFVILFALKAPAQTVTTTITAGTTPADAAVNPVTNKIYVANSSSTNVTVIDGVTDTPSSTDLVGGGSDALAVDPVTNRIYVANNNIATVTAGTAPRAVAVNPVTNKIYVANGDSDQ